MKNWFALFCLLLQCVGALAWQGDVSKFTLSGDTVHLTAPAESGTAVLYDTCTAVYNASWRATFKFDYAPSSSNYVKWYVMADSDSLSSCNGYYVRVGYSGKNIALCRQSGLKSETLAAGDENRIEAGTPITIEVTRSEAGEWCVKSIGEYEASYTIETEAVDAAISVNRYSGFWFNYSKTRSTAFHVWEYVHKGKKIDHSDHDAGTVWVDPLTFTPDGDSQGDLAYIYYKLAEPAVGNIYIFNADGVLVKQLLANTQLTTEGVITWDGLSNRNILMPPGIYVVLFEAFTSEKVTIRKKVPFVLGVK